MRILIPILVTSRQYVELYKEEVTLFPLTSKDKAKSWLSSLRSESIHSWAELQALFLKKLFLVQKMPRPKKAISSFATHGGEKFHGCWDRYVEAIHACPTDFKEWEITDFFYEGVTVESNKLLDYMSDREFLSKLGEEALDFLGSIAELTREWKESTIKEERQAKP